MDLVNRDDISKITKLDKLGMPYLALLLMQITKLSKVNTLYKKHYNKTGVDFIDALFEDIGLEFDYFAEELERIPKTGPFITVSNHPLGGIDGLILIKLIAQRRPDFKVMVNFLLQKIEPIKDFFLPVNPFENQPDLKSSLSGIKEALGLLNQGCGIGIFPAGEVSSYNIDTGKITDRAWQEGAIKLIKKSNVPVIPIFFKARNSRLFYTLSSISSTLQTAKLPSEIFNQRNKAIFVRVGNAVRPAEFSALNVQETSDYLRDRTYRLANALDPDSRLKKIKKRFEFNSVQDFVSIAEPQDKNLIEKEIDYCIQKNKRVTSVNNFQVFFAKAKHIPTILKEIGRLREITFRAVGEGTGKSLDLDEYDHYYRHLFLWDSETKQIVGAYRLGIGADIYKKHSMKGFYVKTLFKIEPQAEHIFKQGLEMGRAFIIKEYQQKPIPLYILWKSIVQVVFNKRHKIRYIVGCVSISSQFSSYSKSIMIEFLKRHFLDAELAKYIQPKKEYRVKMGPLERMLIDNTTPEDINKFDKYINEIEPGNMRFPILLKKYIKQNGKILAFNVDPKFNNAVDGLMYIDINDLPEQTVKPVLEELEKATNQSQA